MRWILGLIVGLTLAGAAWAQQPAIVEQKSYEREAPAPEFAIPIRQIDDEAKEQRERETLEIQRRATVAAEQSLPIAKRAADTADQALLIGWVQLMATLLSIGGLLVTIFYTRKAIRTAQDANEIARRIHIEENRPWVALSNIQLRVDQEHRKFIKLTAENVGRMPALRASFTAAILEGGDEGHIRHAIDIYSKSVPSIQRNDKPTLFPGQAVDFTCPVDETLFDRFAIDPEVTHFIYCVAYSETCVTAGVFTYSHHEDDLDPYGRPAFSTSRIDRRGEWIVT